MSLLKTSHVPELVAPAGSLDKLKTAFHFGADACYLGLKDYSMRSFAGNFTMEELATALTISRSLGRKIYVTVNIQAGDRDMEGMERAFRDLAELRPDAVVVGDPGVWRLGQGIAKHLRFHLSTQSNVTNTQSARFWTEQGIQRIVLARELSIPQIAQIVRECPGEFEVFVHGAVCVAYSGRCFMSLYWAGRDPRRGECAQACRWPYVLLEDRLRPGQPNRVEEDERGTYFFDPKDLCALPVLADLVGSGVQALKIEGRTRSLHYVAVVTDLYRTALNVLAAEGRQALEALSPVLRADLARLTWRGLSTHFLTGAVPEDSYNPTGAPMDHRNIYLGIVEGSSDRGPSVTLRNRLSPGDVIQVVSPGLRRDTLLLQGLWDPAGNPLTVGQPGTRVILQGAFQAQAGAIVRRATDS